MKKIFLILLFLISTLSFGQQMYPSPQTISWDAPTDLPTVGVTEYEIFLIRMSDGNIIPDNIRKNENEYIFLGRGSSLSITIDLQITNFQGDFVVAIRTTYTYNEVIKKSNFAYSDIKEDVANETFFLRYLGKISENIINKPIMIKFNGGE